MSYSKKVLDHFRHPKNLGKMDNHDAQGRVGNVICGDVMVLYIKVGKNKLAEEIIEDISFETFGCAAAIATSSMVTELAKGKLLTEALRIDRNQIVDQLDGLPPVKIHCSVLAADALAEAIYNYWSEKKGMIPRELRERHKRIRAEKEIIEKKYKGWIKK